MFTHADLISLIDAAPPIGVSLFLPTHRFGRETRQDPVRLRQLLASARERLGEAGVPAAESERVLAPAVALLDDHDFWQHGDEGLAVFLGDGAMTVHRTPFALPERAMVGPGFHIRPLLPGVTADGTYRVLTLTADTTRLFEGTRHRLEEIVDSGLPSGMDEEADRESSLQSSPFGRPHTADASMPRAQAYGDSPEDWRKARLVEHARRVAAAVREHAADRPLVVVADAVLGGQFMKAQDLGAQLLGMVEANPESLGADELRAAALALAGPRLDESRVASIERFRARAGASADSGAGSGATSTDPAAILTAAREGRVETLLLVEGAKLPDCGAAGSSAPPPDALDEAIKLTLRFGGAVVLVDPGELDEVEAAAATLRY